jgi:hypothetical protein
VAAAATVLQVFQIFQVREAAAAALMVTEAAQAAQEDHLQAILPAAVAALAVTQATAAAQAVAATEAAQAAALMEEIMDFRVQQHLVVALGCTVKDQMAAAAIQVVEDQEVKTDLQTEHLEDLATGEDFLEVAVAANRTILETRLDVTEHKVQ